jgi:hypothetical protein
MPIPGPLLWVVLAFAQAHDAGSGQTILAADAISQPNGASTAQCASSKDAAKTIAPLYTRHKKGSAAKKTYHPVGEKRDYTVKAGAQIPGVGK